MADNLEKEFLEIRKIEALEKIAESLNDLTNWFEDIDKDEWGDRMQFYLAEFFKLAKGNEETSDNSTL